MPISEQTSRYLPIWKQLKEKGECRVNVNPIFHRRIIKAVKKRRDKDTEFLFLLAETHKKHRILYRINGTVIQFYLKIELSITGL